MEDICRFWHLTSIGVIEKIALRNIDLLFEGKVFENVISPKRLTVDVAGRFASNDTAPAVELLLGSELLCLSLNRFFIV